MHTTKRQRLLKHSLGEWNLSDLPDKHAAPMRIKTILRLTKQFAKSKTKLNSRIKITELLDLVSKIEKISELFSEVASHASLSYAADTQSEENTARVATLGRLSAQIENKMLFFDQWWKLELDETSAQKLYKGLGELRAHFEHMRLGAKHTLPEPQERIINIMDVTGSSALVRLYDTITSKFEYKMGTKRMGREKLTMFVRNPSARIRRAAYKELLTKFAQNRGVLGDIYTNIASEWNSIEVGLRSYDSAISVRNMANNVDDKTISALLRVCEKNAGVFRRFFVLKAKMLKLDILQRYDLYAPTTRSRIHYTYDTALRNVLTSMTDFDPKMTAMARKVIDECHIDSSIRKGKRDGAFCSTVSPKHTPYVLLSFTGVTEDLFTLAHELGHAIHSIAASSQSILTQHAPLPVAETASTFSEMLLHDRIMQNSHTTEKHTLLTSKIDSLYATIGRQSFFTMFEINAHKLVANGASTGDLSKEYMKNLRAQFGRSITITEDFANEWVAIPHFYHAPFYCYAYSFGNLMALSLFSRYKREGAKFSRTYLDILAAGGSLKPEKLMGQHGFDISNAKFWQEGFDYIKAQIAELEKLD